MYQTIFHSIGYIITTVILLYYEINEIIQILNYILLYGYINNIMKLLRNNTDFMIKKYSILKYIFLFVNSLVLLLIIYQTNMSIYDCYNIDCYKNDKLELFGIILYIILLFQYLIHILYPLVLLKFENNININNINLNQYEKLFFLLICFTAVISYNLWVPILIHINDKYVILYQVYVILLCIFMMHLICNRNIVTMQHYLLYSVTISLYISIMIYSILYILLYDIKYLLLNINLIILIVNIILCLCVYNNIHNTIHNNMIMENLIEQYASNNNNNNINNNINNNNIETDELKMVDTI
jgi:hypothetical protein